MSSQIEKLKQKIKDLTFENESLKAENFSLLEHSKKLKTEIYEYMNKIDEIESLSLEFKEDFENSLLGEALETLPYPCKLTRDLKQTSLGDLLELEEKLSELNKGF